MMKIHQAARLVLAKARNEGITGCIEEVVGAKREEEKPTKDDPNKCWRFQRWERKRKTASKPDPR